MSLSEKRYKSYEPEFHYKEKDVKEFIKQLKEKQSFIMNNSDYTEDDLISEIDKLAGENLK